jgi:uridine phosphorylase
VPKITKRVVDATEVRAKDYVVWDDELPGFGIRVFASGIGSGTTSISASRSGTELVVAASARPILTSRIGRVVSAGQ